MGKWGNARKRKAAQRKAERRKNQDESIQESSKPKNKRLDYEDIPKLNEKLELYYKNQRIIPENEWDLFMNTIRTSLPATFRVTASRTQREALLYLIKNKFVQNILRFKAQNDQLEKVEIFPLPWYPGNFAWQMNLTRQDIRKTEAYNQLHNFLMSETDCGNISRQETVSMIPPLALKVQPHHKVLDMCAAPGSKTAQIIEMLHRDDSRSPEGFVIANDLDNQRCYMLVHQAKRLQSPALIVTNEDSSEYPDIFQTLEGKLLPIKFDRILCDVPCSGDGTIRKNMLLWKKWNPTTAVTIHGTQYKIVRRGLELLDVGGLLVYSTCSLNPIENEAVIHRILEDSEGALELEEIALPGLKYSPGVSKWYPAGNDLVSYMSFDDIPDKGKTSLRPFHFPPSDEDAAKYQLQKCVRILPHQQDTGGFFIARLKKVNILPWESVANACDRIPILQQTKQGKDGQPLLKLQRGWNEDPFLFMKEEDPAWASLKKFYSLQNLESIRLITRSNVGKRKNISFTTNLVRNIVESNEGFVKIINTGVKVFARSDNKNSECEYRIASEGLSSILPFINTRVVKFSKVDLILLLRNNNQDAPPKLETLTPEGYSAVKDLQTGSFVILTELEIGENNGSFSVEVIGWRGQTSIRAYVGLNERIHFLRMCGEDVSQFEKNKYKDQSNIETE